MLIPKENRKIVYKYLFRGECARYTVHQLGGGTGRMSVWAKGGTKAKF